MTEAPNFAELLNINTANIEKPKPWPVGTYSFIVKGLATGVSKEKKTPFVSFECQPIGHEADVSAEAITAAKLDLSKKTQKLDFYITQDSLWRLVEFLQKLGIKTENRNLNECIAEAPMRGFKAYVINEMAKDMSATYSKIDQGKILAA